MIEGTTAANPFKGESPVVKRFKERFDLECKIMTLEDFIKCGKLSPELERKCKRLLRTYKQARAKDDR